VRALVVVPTYEEVGTIARIIELVRAEDERASVLVVDDASPDGTAGAAREAGNRAGRVEVLSRPAKRGLGSAYRDGFRWGIERGYDVLVEMDADLSHDPRDLPRLLDAVAAGADLAIGSRYTAGGSIAAWTPGRRALSRWGNRYAAVMLGLPVADATSGFRAFRADALAAIGIESVGADGYGFQIETAYRMHRTGRKLVELPIRFEDRTAGATKMTRRIVLEALVLVTWWGLRDRVTRRRHPR
jgi:dolichol-phosphate mannosyltransferase